MPNKKMFPIKILVLFFICFFSSIVFSQNCIGYIPLIRENLSEAKICPEVMLNDLQKLREALEKIHPDLYHYISKEELDSNYKVAIKSVSKDITVYQFAKTIATFLNSLRDSHTNFNPQSLLFLGLKEKGTLPFYLKKINDKFFISSLFNHDSLRGKEIIQLNEFSIVDVFKESLAFSLIEGSSYSAQEEIATKGMALIFSQMSKIKLNDEIILKYVSGGDTLSIRLKATSAKNLFLYRDIESDNSIEVSFETKSTGILRISSFEPRNLRFFKKEITNFFNEVEQRKCNHVIIDLRDNQGGYVKAHEFLISFLNYKNYEYEIEHVYKRSNYDPFAKMSALKKIRFKWSARKDDSHGLQNEYDFFRSELGTIKVISYRTKPKNDKNIVYNDKCTLLMNGLSMSASVLFAEWFRYYNRGEIIGTPCLGSMSGTFGSSATFTLPRTGLPVMISTMKFNPSHSHKIELKSINPDKLITYSIEDIISNRDPILHYLKIEKR